MATQLELQDLGIPLTDAVEKMRRGEEITIADHGNPVAKIIPFQSPISKRGRGLFKGQIWMAADFNSPLPEEELREWEK
jgi:antitoxin (DNA-binding transcriptional repressor) of toxin-antitoxin stability system